MSRHAAFPLGAPVITVRVGVDSNEDSDPSTPTRFVEAVTGRGHDLVEVRLEEYGSPGEGLIFLSATVPDPSGVRRAWNEIATPIGVAQFGRLIAQLTAARDRARAEGLMPAADASCSLAPSTATR